MRVRPDAIYITTPPCATMQDVEAALQKYGDKLLKQRDTLQQNHIGNKLPIVSENFIFRLQHTVTDRFQLKKEGREYTLLCPENFDLCSTTQQKWLHSVIEKAMTQRAKEVLPHRLQQLAEKFSFVYKHTTIRIAHTRWGSCSSNGTISLNAYLIQLPDELIDYVLLHELCHTRHMNHSPRFWELLDKCTGYRAKLLRKQLHDYRI